MSLPSAPPRRGGQVGKLVKLLYKSKEASALSMALPAHDTPQ